MHRAALLVLALGLLQAGCLPKPKQDYTIDQIAQIGSLEEIMRVQAATMDPLFAQRDQRAFSPEEFARLADAGRRIQATSATARDKFAAKFKPSFASYASQLNSQAGDLLAAAEARDAPRAAATLGAMRETCRSCHKENR